MAMQHFSSYESMFNYLVYNPLLGISILLLFAILIYAKPKFFLGTLAIVLFIAAIFYLISSLSDTGTAHKQKLINKSKVNQEKNLLLIY